MAPVSLVDVAVGAMVSGAAGRSDRDPVGAGYRKVRQLRHRVPVGQGQVVAT